MGILRRLREWREDADGALKGPALKAEEASIGTPAQQVEQIVGGELDFNWQFDDNPDPDYSDGWLQIDTSNINFDPGRTYQLKLKFLNVGANEAKITVNETQDPADGYWYRDASATEFDGQDEIRLIETDSTATDPTIIFLIGAGRSSGRDTVLNPIHYQYRVFRNTSPELNLAAFNVVGLDSIEIFREDGGDVTDNEGFEVLISEVVDV